MISFSGAVTVSLNEFTWIPDAYKKYFQPLSVQDLGKLKIAYLQNLCRAVGVKDDLGESLDHTVLSQHIAESLSISLKKKNFRDGTGQDAVSIITAVKNVEIPELMQAILPQHVVETLSGLMRDCSLRNRTWIHGIFEVARAVQDSEPLAKAFKQALGDTGKSVGAEITAYIDQVSHFTDGMNERHLRPASLTQLGGEKTVKFVLSAFAGPDRPVPVSSDADPEPVGMH